MWRARAVVGHDTCIGAGTVLEEACQVTDCPEALEAESGPMPCLQLA